MAENKPPDLPTKEGSVWQENATGWCVTVEGDDEAFAWEFDVDRGEWVAPQRFNEPFIYRAWALHLREAHERTVRASAEALKLLAADNQRLRAGLPAVGIDPGEEARSDG